MSAYEHMHHHLRRVWDRLSPAARQARYQQAVKRQAVVEAVAARAPPISERAALRKAGIDRTKFRRWQRRYRDHGFDGLLDWRLPPKGPVTQEVTAVICTLRRADPDCAVETIIDHVAKHHGVVTNGTTVKRILREAGLARRRGPPAGRGPREQRLEMGGMKLVEAALWETGYLEALTQGVRGHRR